MKRTTTLAASLLMGTAILSACLTAQAATYVYGLFDVSCGFGLIQQAPHRAANQIDHGDEVALVAVPASP